MSEHPFKKERVKIKVPPAEKKLHTLLAPGFLVCGPVSTALAEEVTRLALENDHVMIRGDTGTGKEGVARALHELSTRAKAPFVVINCACLTNELADSEFFGYEKGAFTGAGKNRNGLFMEADGGTLFLDEIDSLRMDIQGKLLRTLQSGEIRSVGAKRTTTINVRVVAATKVRFEKLLSDGLLRADLLYRFPFSLALKRLEERSEEIAPLVYHYMEQLSAEKVEIDEKVMELLVRYSWPGNIRELINVLKRMLVMRSDERLRVEHLPEEIRMFNRKPGRKRLYAV